YESKEFKEQRELRGLFKFNKKGKELDAFVKKQTNTFRELAKEYKLIK
ncbi:tripartite tricarboxylate transporter substrate binding protein, partial [Campylobacter jejuni]|nr:tripartite tricarboxylate transporter substrate binding protein [Campylobacter jejuni]